MKTMRCSATHRGHSIDGVLPDDQRRGGPFEWPPPRENYVYEALQGATVQAALLSRAGYDAWDWGDQALLRRDQVIAIPAICAVEIFGSRYHSFRIVKLPNSRFQNRRFGVHTAPGAQFHEF